jgi:thymidylate kinase
MFGAWCSFTFSTVGDGGITRSTRKGKAQDYRAKRVIATFTGSLLFFLHFEDQLAIALIAAIVRSTVKRRGRDDMAGRFLSFEGIDGSGKSTLTEGLVARLRDTGIDAVAVRKTSMPGDDPFARQHFAQLKAALWDYPKDADISKLGNRHWLHLLAAWYAALDVRVVRNHLAAGRWVVSDGWFYKYLARFALKPEIGEHFAANCFQGLSRPDKVYYLDVPPEVAFRRRANFHPSELGAFDGLQGEAAACYLAYQKQVRAAYHGLARQHDWYCVDADSRSPAELLDNLGPT